jgi:hypothetical protein
MGSISLEAFDSNLRGKYSHWILPSVDICTLPDGFQDQILSGNPAIQTSILLMAKSDSKSWLISAPWDLTFTPESPTDWSLILSLLPHLKKPILIVTAPKCNAPFAFWAKCLTQNTLSPTCVSLRYPPSEISQANQLQQTGIPYSIFFPKLDLMTELQFTKIASILPSSIQQSIQSLDLRSIYRELRGAGASLCLSQVDSRVSTNTSGFQQYNAMWYYPENNEALRLHISELRMILRTVTELLSGP